MAAKVNWWRTDTWSYAQSRSSRKQNKTRKTKRNKNQTKNNKTQKENKHTKPQRNNQKQHTPMSSDVTSTSMGEKDCLKQEMIVITSVGGCCYLQRMNPKNPRKNSSQTRRKNHPHVRTWNKTANEELTTEPLASADMSCMLNFQAHSSFWHQWRWAVRFSRNKYAAPEDTITGGDHINRTEMFETTAAKHSLWILCCMTPHSCQSLAVEIKLYVSRWRTEGKRVWREGQPLVQ